VESSVSMAAPTRSAMPAADAAWLHMDRATNPMVVNSLSLLGGVPDHATVVALLEERLVGRFLRFRQRVVDSFGKRPAFEDDPPSTSKPTCTAAPCRRPATGPRWRRWSAT
jgi:hypothetical protein